jgi:hypothetical protein
VISESGGKDSRHKHSGKADSVWLNVKKLEREVNVSVACIFEADFTPECR